MTNNATRSLKSLFLLDPEIIFLNHGSFGACPRPVFDAYQAWQLRLERQPVLFLGRQYPTLERQARQTLGEYLHADPDDLAFVPNATHGVNIVARSLALQPGDEILATDHEYGACDYTWEFIAAKNGAKYVRQSIPLPLPSDEEIVELLWQSVTPRTKLIFISHITSPTAVRLPVELICRRAHQAGIQTLIDGAHAPGQIDLDLPQIGADFYTGNCHKWLLAPKGSAFLFARKEVQPLIEPLVVSWGYRPSKNTTSGSQFIDYLSWSGTMDPAAYLSVPAAIEFQRQHNWDEARAECRRLARRTRQRLLELIGMPAICDDDRIHQMFSVLLPQQSDPDQLKSSLYDEYRIEAPIIEWNGCKLLRVSIQVYNSAADADVLLQALQELL
ncbi:MAG: aminotransferase class V-fold PLP-dependent enzyme [Anaerolineales bacterium]|nr:aminotransferase class V-fold PLP-dependent enzyme [Anaerolineales bacterium]